MRLVKICTTGLTNCDHCPRNILVHTSHGVSWTLIFGGAKQGWRQDFGSDKI